MNKLRTKIKSSLYKNTDGAVNRKLKIVKKLSNFSDIFINILKNMDKAKKITPGKRPVVCLYLKNSFKQKDMTKKLKLLGYVVCRI